MNVCRMQAGEKTDSGFPSSGRIGAFSRWHWWLARVSPSKLRRPKASPLFRLVQDHFHTLQTVYDKRFVRTYGEWRPVLRKVANTEVRLVATIGARGDRAPA